MQAAQLGCGRSLVRSAAQHVLLHVRVQHMYAPTRVLVCVHVREYVCRARVCCVLVYVCCSCMLHVRMRVLVRVEWSLRDAHTAFGVCTMYTLLFSFSLSSLSGAVWCACACVCVVYVCVAGHGGSNLMRCDMCVSCVAHTTCYVSLATLCYSPSCCACDCEQCGVRYMLCMCVNRGADRHPPSIMHRSTKPCHRGCMLSSVQLSNTAQKPFSEVVDIYPAIVLTKRPRACDGVLHAVPHPYTTVPATVPAHVTVPLSYLHCTLSNDISRVGATVLHTAHSECAQTVCDMHCACPTHPTHHHHHSSYHDRTYVIILPQQPLRVHRVRGVTTDGGVLTVRVAHTGCPSSGGSVKSGVPRASSYRSRLWSVLCLVVFTRVMVVV